MKIDELTKKPGFDISIDEAKVYLTDEETELGEDDLDAVAGSTGYTKIYRPVDYDTGDFQVNR